MSLALRRALPLLAVVLAPSLTAAPAAARDGWTTTGSLTTGRSNHAAVLLTNGKVLVAGGLSGFVRTASAELYDPATGTWSQTGSMAIARSDHTMTVLADGKVLVAGGVGADSAPTASAELYEPVTGTWTPADALETPRTSPTATVLTNGKVLAAGGLRRDCSAPTDPPCPLLPLRSAELYDPTTDEWTRADELDVPRADHTATRLSDGRVLVAGGRREECTAAVADPTPTTPPPPCPLLPTGAVEIYDVTRSGWVPTGTLDVPRADHSATLLENGRLLIAGGADAQLAPRRSAELFDPSTSTWRALGRSMSVGRANHTATLLPDGRVLVAGGGTGGSPDLQSAELYDPGAENWTVTGSLGTARFLHTATLLTGGACGGSCGKVLVAGGVRQSSTRLDSAELYGPLPAAAGPSSAGAVPGLVHDLSARALSARRIRLAFSAPPSPDGPSTPALSYVVKQSRRRVTPESFSRARSLCGGVCAFSPGRVGDRVTLTVTGLRPRTTYYYALRAMGASGVLGPVSNVVRVRTRRDVIAPGRIVSVSAEALRGARVGLVFRAPGSDRGAPPPARDFVIKQSRRQIHGSRGFRSARSLCGGVCRFAPRRVGQRLRLTIGDLCARTTYYYAIRAKDGAGNLGPRSRARRVTTGAGGRC